MSDVKKKPGYYAIIPAEVRYDTDLKASEKLLYGEITALCNAKGFCWAKNKYFAKLYDVTPETVSRWISSLHKKNYIERIIVKDEKGQVIDRKLFINTSKTTKSPDDENDKRGAGKNIKGGIDEKVKDNTTSSNNTTSNEYKPSDKSDNAAGDEFSIKKQDNGMYDYPEDFEEIWSAYPENNCTKKAAWRKWAARRRDGISQDKLLKAAKGYAQYIKKENQQDYVKYFSTFFGPDEWWKQYLKDQKEHKKKMDEIARKKKEQLKKQIARAEKLG